MRSPRLFVEDDAAAWWVPPTDAGRLVGEYLPRPASAVTVSTTGAVPQPTGLRVTVTPLDEFSLEAAGHAVCYLDGTTRRRNAVVEELRAGTAPVSSSA